METIEIKQTLVKATSIDQFKRNGKAVMNMPYWTKLKDGTLWFDFINSGTSKDSLIRDIEANVIFIREKDSIL